MTTVERMERAICDADGPDGPSYLTLARAAMAAIEPSPEMVEAAAEASFGWRGRFGTWAAVTEETRAVWREAARSILKAALAAALKEGGG